MTKLEQLIKKFCPNGVKFEPLWKVTTWDKRFNGVDKKKQEHVCKFKHVSAAQLKSMSVDNGDVLLLSTGNFAAYTSKELAGECLNNNEVISLPSGGTATIKYTNGLFVDSSNLLCITSNKQKYNLKFIYYYLLTRQEFFDRNFRGSGIKHPNMQAILELKVPVPSIEVQTEIVRILDKFTSITAELTAELTLRKKQYEFYRDKILTFKREREIMLGQIADFKNGKGHEQFIDPQGQYIVVNSKFISTNGAIVKTTNNQLTPVYVDDILMVMSDLPNGKALAKCFVVDKNDKYSLNQRVGCITVKDKIALAKFVYYILNRNKQLLRFDNHVDQTNLRKDDILKVKLRLPSLNRQKLIVDYLDKLNFFVNNINYGLPAEIALRQKQYEYYRNKLLTFKELRE